MRILIDTNIFITREDNKSVPSDLQNLLQILNSTDEAVLLIHPKSLEDLRRDKNEDRKQVAISKIKTYPLLKSPPDPSDDLNFLNIVKKASTANDYVDNFIIYSVFKNAVDFLITEDRGIHRKALKLEVSDRVLYVDEAIRVFSEYYLPKKIIHPPALKKDFVYNLDINDTFFDSLRAEYDDFNYWFVKIQREARECFVFKKDDGKIGALLIYKKEDEAIPSNPPLDRRRRLKLCTFKSEKPGYMGELFIKLAVDYCIKNNIDEIYLTKYPKDEDHLAVILNEYGFETVAKKNGEDVFLKKLFQKSEYSSFDTTVISTKHWPSFYDGPKVKKFLAPVRSDYHDKLFIGYPKRQTSLLEYSGNFIIEGNTIKKAYLCHSRITKISPGDILLIYRSHDIHAITSLGVIEKVFPRMRDKERIIRQVGKRTVYSISEIEEMTTKPVLTLLFRLHFHFETSLKLIDLQNKDLLSSAPQSIMELSHERYTKIKNMGHVDERFTIS